MTTLHHIRDFTMWRAMLLVALIAVGHLAHVWHESGRTHATLDGAPDGATIWRALILIECDEDKVDDPLI